jgi:hypothetical protein
MTDTANDTRIDDADLRALVRDADVEQTRERRARILPDIATLAAEAGA